MEITVSQAFFRTWWRKPNIKVNIPIFYSKYVYTKPIQLIWQIHSHYSLYSWPSLLLSRGRSNRIINHNNIPISKKLVFSIHIRVYQFLQRIQLHKAIWPCCVTVEFPLSFGFSLTQVLMPFLPFFWMWHFLRVCRLCFISTLRLTLLLIVLKNSM